jgi:hypothetical protein
LTKSNLIVLELIWWIIAFALAYAVIYPITSQAEYVHILPNMLNVVLSVTYIRYILTFRQLWFLKNRYLRIGWFFFNIYLFVYILNRLEFVTGAINSFAVFDLFKHHDLTLSSEKQLIDYISVQYSSFSIAAFVGIRGFNIRILGSFWSRSKVKEENKIKFE